MNDLKSLFIKPVKAQSLDAFSQPTFGPIEIGNNSVINGSVLISSTKTSVVTGEKFKISVEIQTNDVVINEFRLTIDFDPTKLSVVDADPTTTGTQISLTDEVFTVENPEENNFTTSIGRIRLVATTDSAVTLNKKVAEIEFQAQSTGTTSVKVVEGSTATQLIRQAGVGLSYTSNQINLQVSAKQTTNDNTDTDTDTDPGTNTGNGGTTGNIGNGGTVTQIPDTATPEELLPFFSVILGTILIVLGASLISNKKSKRVIE